VTFKVPTKINYAYSFLKLTLHLHHSSKIKSHREVTNSRNKGFSSFFLLVRGRILIRTNKYGSRRPKNIRIQRIQNTESRYNCKKTDLEGALESGNGKQCQVLLLLCIPEQYNILTISLQRKTSGVPTIRMLQQRLTI
jgi:hypothetical protein